MFLILQFTLSAFGLLFPFALFPECAISDRAPSFSARNETVK